MLTTYLTAFPDLQFTTESTVVEDNRAAMIWIANGTHRGRLMNIPPSEHKIQVHGVSVLTLENSRITRDCTSGMLRDYCATLDYYPNSSAARERTQNFSRVTLFRWRFNM